jgi:hypothetical protein
MKKLSANDPILKTISIKTFVAYLGKMGWRQIDHPNNKVILFEKGRDDNGKPLRLILPRNKELEDAKTRLAEALYLLAIMEHTSPHHVANEIMSAKTLFFIAKEVIKGKRGVFDNPDLIRRLIVYGAFIFIAGALGYFIGGNSWEQKALANAWIRKDDWEQIAKASHWTPKSLCSLKSNSASLLKETPTGINVKFGLTLLSSDLRWRLGSTTQVETQDGLGDLRQYIQNINDTLAEAKGIVCIGTASAEGDQLEEVARAQERADYLAALVRMQQLKDIPIYTLNLGVSRAVQEKEDSRNSREIQLILINKLDDYASIESDILQILSGNNFELNSNKYSLFKFNRRY